jgi:polysaccharide biosynthesis protein PslH
MNILFLASHLPSPAARQAGQKISYRLCEYLLRRHAVHLLSFGSAAEEASCDPGCLRMFSSHRVIPVNTANRLLGIVQTPDLPLVIAGRASRTFRDAIASILAGQQFDTVIFDHMAMWQYAEDTPCVLRVGIAHDVLSQLWSRRAESSRGAAALTMRAEARRLRTWEKKAGSKLDVICSLSQKDSQLLSEVTDDRRHYVLQPWFARSSTASLTVAPKEDRSLVFSGAFDRRENVNAVRFMVEEILPRIAAAGPGCTLYLTGFAGSRFARRTVQAPGVRPVGFVPDLPGFLSRMQIGLLPLRLGAGIKIKVLECMAAGLAVVTTPVGCEGIEAKDGVELLLGRTADELAQHTIFLLENREFREAMGDRAREFIRANYDFERSAAGFERILMSGVSQRRRAGNRTDCPQIRNKQPVLYDRRGTLD